MFFAMPLSLTINTSFKTSCGYLTPESKNDVFTIERRTCLAGVIILDSITSIKYYLFSTRKNRHVLLCTLSLLCFILAACILSIVHRLHITMDLLQYLVELWSSQLYYAPLSSVESVLHILFLFLVVTVQFYWWVPPCMFVGGAGLILIRATLPAFLLLFILAVPLVSMLLDKNPLYTVMHYSK